MTLTRQRVCGAGPTSEQSTMTLEHLIKQLAAPCTAVQQQSRPSAISSRPGLTFRPWRPAVELQWRIQCMPKPGEGPIAPRMQQVLCILSFSIIVHDLQCVTVITPQLGSVWSVWLRSTERGGAGGVPPSPHSSGMVSAS